MYARAAGIAFLSDDAFSHPLVPSNKSINAEFSASKLCRGKLGVWNFISLVCPYRPNWIIPRWTLAGPGPPRERPHSSQRAPAFIHVQTPGCIIEEQSIGFEQLVCSGYGAVFLCTKTKD
jgi:hypothetical protein